MAKWKRELNLAKGAERTLPLRDIDMYGIVTYLDTSCLMGQVAPLVGESINCSGFVT